jgi:hypothetical protein
MGVFALSVTVNNPDWILKERWNPDLAHGVVIFKQVGAKILGQNPGTRTSWLQTLMFYFKHISWFLAMTNFLLTFSQQGCLAWRQHVCDLGLRLSCCERSLLLVDNRHPESDLPFVHLLHHQHQRFQRCP